MPMVRAERRRPSRELTQSRREAGSWDRCFLAAGVSPSSASTYPEVWVRTTALSNQRDRIPEDLPHLLQEPLPFQTPNKLDSMSWPVPFRAAS